MQPRLGHVGDSTGDTQGRDDGAVGAADGRGHAADAQFILFQIQGIAFGGMAAQARAIVGPGQEVLAQAGLPGTPGHAFAIEGFPLLFGEIQHQRLADAGQRQRHAQADSGSHLQAPAAGQLVQIKDIATLAHPEVHGVAAVLGQALQMGPGHAGQRQLFASLVAEGDEVAAQDQPPPVAAQVAGLGQGGDQAVGGAAGTADGGADLGQVVGPGGHGFKHAQTAKQPRWALRPCWNCCRSWPSL